MLRTKLVKVAAAYNESHIDRHPMHIRAPSVFLASKGLILIVMAYFMHHSEAQFQLGRKGLLPDSVIINWSTGNPCELLKLSSFCLV